MTSMQDLAVYVDGYETFDFLQLDMDVWVSAMEG